MPPPPPPAEGWVPRLVPAPCMCRACDMRATKGRRQAPPRPPPHTSAPPRVGDEGREGRAAAPPPEDKVARWGGSGERVRDGPRDRARRKHAPCKPQRGGAPGERTQGGKGDDGSHAACPPPLQRDKRRTSCLRRAFDVPTPEDGQRGRPPPHPLLPHPPRKGARTASRWRGDMGGGQGTDRRAGGRDGRRAVKKKTKTQPRTQQINGPE